MEDVELAFELTRAALSEIEPAEVDVLDTLGTDFVVACRSNPSGDGALGFDVAQISIAVVSASVASGVVDYLQTVTADFAKEEGKGLLQRLAKRLRTQRDEAAGKKSAPDLGPPLPDARIEQIRALAFRHARTLGLSEARAEVLASAMAGGLAKPSAKPSARSD